jgi:glutamate dehydrogenase/leucine dehydrogenase
MPDLWPHAGKAYPSSLENVRGEFEAAARHLGLQDDLIQVLEQPQYSVRMNLPVRMDNGRLRNFTAYHSIHSTKKGPAVGGLRYRNGVEQRIVDAFAFWSSNRCALLNIPFGGSSSAVDCDPATCSAGELERITRAFVVSAASFLGPDFDVLTSNQGTNQQIMCWLMDTYSCQTKRHAPAAVLGKPLDLGGMKLKTHPVAVGAQCCIERAAAENAIDMNGARVVIQGFGSVGAPLVRGLRDSGAVIVAVADITGAYVNENGINVDELLWHRDSYGMLYGAESELDVEKMDDPLEVFEIPVEILIPAAVELQITEENVDRINAKIIAEVAFDPVSPEADQALTERGVLVIPDILCGSGGVSGYYLEWVQNRMGYYWNESRVRAEIERLVGRAFDNCTAVMARDNVSMRLAASVCAVSGIFKAVEMRGSHD